MGNVESLASRVASMARAEPDRLAMVDGGRRSSYGAFVALASGFASQLLASGLQPADRVAIVLPNRIEAAVACYGTWMAGGVVVPLNVQARARDFAPWIEHSGARFIVHERANNDVAIALETLESPPRAFALSDDEAICPAAEPGTGDGEAAQPCAAHDGLAMILYTSGTTGAPKGVMLSHANLLANAKAVTAYLELCKDDSVLCVLPFYYAYGASVLHTHLINGAAVHLAKNLLFPHLLVEALATHAITGFSGVPSTFALLLDHVELGRHDLSRLRYVTQAGGPMTPTLTARLRQALPRPRLFVMYGQTEATSRLTWLPPEQLDAKPGSVGIPVDGVTIRIVHEDGSTAAAGESGEVWVRGPNVMLGYWRNAEATQAALRDGWLKTGDMGRLDGDGYLYIAGRRSDMIKTGAHRVHPTDVEEAIAEIPGVIEAAVVGIDDEVLGQVIKAFVVVERITEQLANEIKAHCRTRLATYKIPRHIEFVSSLPRTASGKVQRAQLLARQTTA
ncbi:AMP-binding protein [Lysobacter olei]